MFFKVDQYTSTVAENTNKTITKSNLIGNSTAKICKSSDLAHNGPGALFSKLMSNFRQLISKILGHIHVYK